ncbi:Ncp1p [Saccharomyces cerevisiae]|nr:Ncp1p [Saccharomyces cerevisiae]
MSDDGDITAVSSGNRDIAQVVTENNKNYLVLYASQTGTAEDYAKKFSKELVAKFNLNVMCADVENYDFESLNDVPVIVSIFISTYGEGDFPDGAVNFEDFICNAEAGAPPRALPD